MKISRHTWHYRAYEGWYVRKYGLTPEQHEARWKDDPGWHGRRLDLCHYCRAVFLWAPGRWIVHGTVGSPIRQKPWPYLAAITATIGSIVWLHYNAHGFFVFLGLIALFAAAIVAGGLIIAGIIWAHEDKDITWTNMKSTVSNSLIGQYAIAKKKKVCPLIEVSDD